MNEQQIEEWAKTYIRAENIGVAVTEHPDWWAIERFINVGSEDVPAQEAWKAILAVVKLAPPEKVLGALAAGPLEDLIEVCGEEVIEQIETEAKKSPAFRKLLGGVWESGSKEVWARVQACQGEIN